MDLKLGADGDLDLTNFVLTWLDGIDAIKQHVLIRLRFFFKEWFLDPTMGVPYKEYVFVKNHDLDSISALFKNVILDTPGIINPLQDFNLAFNSNTRLLTVSFTANTTEGVLTLSDQPIGVIM